MKSNSLTPYVIGISSVSGGGKTALVKTLASLLPDTAEIYFDDYDDTNIYPDDLYQWAIAGADPKAFDTPQLTNDLQALKYERDDLRYIVFEAPLGRTHERTSALIDLMVFIDTPLDVAMARRILRDYLNNEAPKQADILGHLRKDLSHYLVKARVPHLEIYQALRPSSDLIIDGILDLDSLAEKVIERINAAQGDAGGSPARSVGR